MKERAQAIRITDQALNQALSKIDELGEAEFKDAKTIIELMKENLNAWQLEDPVQPAAAVNSEEDASHQQPE